MKKQSIIVVDDSDSLRDRIKELITKAKHLELVGEADNGADAIKLITEKKPNYVTLDISMPKKSGIEVLKAIEPQKNDIKVIMVSNYADKIFRVKCMKLGASHFLDKTNEFQLLTGLFEQA